MAEANRFGEWLAKVRQIGDQARAAAGQPAIQRANLFLEGIADGQILTAAILWTVNAEQRITPASGGGVPRISAADGQLNLDPTHLDAIRAAFGGQKPPLGGWKSCNGLALLRIVRTVVVQPATPLVLELFFPIEIGKDKAAIELASDEVVALLSRSITTKPGVAAVDTLNADFWKRMDQFGLALQRSLSVADVAMVAANDGRVLLECDRVSVAIKYGPRAKIAACSGQESIQQRANLIHQMSRLAIAVCELGEPVVYKGTKEGFPESFAEPLAKYLEESRSRMVGLYPLRESLPHHQVEQDLADQKRITAGKVIGCLIVEQSTESDPQPAVMQRTPLVIDHVAAAMSNARHQESIFLLPVWRTIGRTLGWFRGRRLAIGLGIVALIGAVITALAMIPWEYRVEAAGRAMPVQQYDLFAPWDGVVVEVLVENGQVVKAGQDLLKIRSDDLDTELLAAENARDERNKQIAALMQQSSGAARSNRPEDALRLKGEMHALEIEKQGAELQIKKYQERIAALVVKSPVDGVVASFQVTQNLLDRPVRRGDRLIEVMQVEGPWRLELDIPEYRMGHILKRIASVTGQSVPRTDEHSQLAGEGQLMVDYIAATAVSSKYHGKLIAIGTRSNESQEEGTVVECHVEIEKADLPGQRIGAEVTAKIHCGPQSLGYVLFGDVVEFIQRKIWW